MNSYTQSGPLQLVSRIKGDSVEPNYDEGVVREAVTNITISIALLARFLTVMENRPEAAERAQQLIIRVLTDLKDDSAGGSGDQTP